MKVFGFIAMTAIILGSLGLWMQARGEGRDKAAYRHTFKVLGSDWGLPVFLRIFKEDRLLELWVKRDGAWCLKKSYPVLGMSGELGPKTREGDRQAPEGFYEVLPSALNPHSSYHLSFNIAYPNAYDRSLGRTGSLIMVHGGDCSIGCFAMGDEGIEEIYTMVAGAIKRGQGAVPVHVFPFRMTMQRLEKEKESPHAEFWHFLMSADENIAVD